MADLIKELNKQIYKCTLGEDEVIVGDENSPDKFKNKVKFTKWNKENFLSIEYLEDFGEPTIDGDKKVKATKNPKNFYAKKHDENTFKYGLEFNSKPDTNVFTFQLKGWEEFNFFYQPELTQAEIDEEHTRPDDVVGSYAVYHKNKKDHIVGQTNYMTGKFGHIYRPKFIDANGNFVWGSLNITDGIYSVTIPQDFLDNAVYPVIANDTFGKADIGATQWTNADAYTLWGTSFASTGNGTLSKITVYANANAGEATCAIYNDSSGPATKLDNGAEIVDISTPGWNDSTGLTQSITNTTTYWLACLNKDNTIDYQWDAGTNRTEYLNNGSYSSTLPDPFGSGSALNRIMSIYATYTPSGGVATARRRAMIFA